MQERKNSYIIENTKQCMNEKKEEKICEYPDCNEKFLGRGLERYCPEHRKSKYHNKLYHLKYKKEDEKRIKKFNQVIEHSSAASFVVTETCALEGCENKFQVIVYPNQFVYPKFCPEHRNEFKRNIWLKGLHKNAVERNNHSNGISFISNIARTNQETDISTN